MSQWCLWPVLLWACGRSAEAACLREGLEVPQLHPMEMGGPVKLASHNWENSLIQMNIAQILLEEQLNMLTEHAVSLAGSHLGPPALAGGKGCQAPDFAECNVWDPQAHVVFDSWEGGQKTWDAMKGTDAVDSRPDMLVAGYTGFEGTFVPFEAINKGLEESPPAYVEYYKFLNSRRHDLTRYLAPWGEVNAKIRELNLTKAACNSPDMAQAITSRGCEKYVEYTQDFDMFHMDHDGTCSLVSCNDSWILTPACRQDPSSCVAWVSTGDGWGVEEMMQQAVHWNVPLAIVVLPEWGHYTSLPSQISTLWFWFYPDPAFVSTQPQRLMEPRTDLHERRERLFKTGASSIAIKKFVWRLMKSKAPHVHHLFERMVFTNEDVRQFMVNVSQGQKPETVACLWLRENRNTWRAWVDHSTHCASGRGLVDSSGQFVRSRSSASRCRNCTAGRYSRTIADELGATSVCEPCGSGHFQDLNGTAFCHHCPPGHFAARPGQSLCEACTAGTFQAFDGQASCQSCVAGTYAATSRSLDCTPCEMGTFADIEGSTACEACPSATYQPREGSVSCDSCVGDAFVEALGRPPETRRMKCVWEVYATVSLLVWFFHCLAIMYCALEVARWNKVIDVRLQGKHTVLTTALPHRFRSKGSTALLVGTGNPELDAEARFRVAVCDNQRIYLMTASGYDFEKPHESSMGFIRLTLGDSLRNSGLCMPLGAEVLAMLGCAWVMALIARLQMMTSVLVASAGIVMGAVVGACVRLWAKSALTPLEKLVAQYREQLAATRAIEGCKTTQGLERSISMGKIVDLYQFFQAFIIDRDMYYVCSNIVKPITADCRLSFAECAGPSRIEWFVSHFWGTCFRHTVDSLSQHAKSVCLSKDWRRVSYWVCSFSNNQWEVEEELGDDWSQSSFYLVLRSGLCKGTAIIMDVDAKPLTRVWCLFEMVQTLILTREEADFGGLHICTDTGVLNLGCAAMDTAMAIARRLINLDLRSASATEAHDLRMIHAYVEQMPGGFEEVNKFLRVCMREALMQMNESFRRDFEKVMYMFDLDLQVQDSALRNCVVTATQSLKSSDRFNILARTTGLPAPRTSETSEILCL